MSAIRHTEPIEVLVRDQRLRRWSLSEKQALVRRTYEPGMSVSLVARQEGVAASLLFQWRKLERQGVLTAVSSGEAVVPASELAAARAEIAKLQRVLGKKTLENEILKEAVQDAAEKKWIARSPLFPKDEPWKRSAVPWRWRARTFAACVAALRRGLTDALDARLCTMRICSRKCTSTLHSFPAMATGAPARWSTAAARAQACRGSTPNGYTA